VANLFPTTDITLEETLETTVSDIKFGSSWRFDFDAGDFVLTPAGRVAAVTGLDAYIEWCKKALHTPRYRYLIYGRNYGHEFEDLLGRGLTRAAIETEIKRMATECLEADPRTASVDNFSFSWDEDTVYFNCDVTSVRSETVNIKAKAVI
jgi:hypothetical protein